MRADRTRLRAALEVAALALGVLAERSVAAESSAPIELRPVALYGADVRSLVFDPAAPDRSLDARVGLVDCRDGGGAAPPAGSPTPIPLARDGLLLVNLGTPEAPRTPEVRRYLREFLSDPRVFDMHPAKRVLVLELFILPFRPSRSAEAYRKIWGERGSPLLFHGQDLAAKMRARLGEDTAVELAMRGATRTATIVRIRDHARATRWSERGGTVFHHRQRRHRRLDKKDLDPVPAAQVAEKFASLGVRLPELQVRPHPFRIGNRSPLTSLALDESLQLLLAHGDPLR